MTVQETRNHDFVQEAWNHDFMQEISDTMTLSKYT